MYIEFQRLCDGAQNTDGYGCMHRKGKTFSAHRFVWQQTKGPIPSGMSVLHTCDVRHCVNPNHLFLGTQSDNMADMHRKGRHTRRKETHCPQGHPLINSNLLQWLLLATGHRKCAICTRNQNALYRVNHRALLARLAREYRAKKKQDALD